MTSNGDRVPPSNVTTAPQAVDAPLTACAIFLVVTISDPARAREALGGLEDLVKTVGFRDPGGRLSCTAGIGSRVWTAVTGHPLPAELRPFEEIAGPAHTAVSTPGDLLFHIRADRCDLCFEFERLLLQSLGDGVHIDDETSGFRYFDGRDLLGFVDGTANPVGPALPEATLVGAEDPDFAGAATSSCRSTCTASAGGSVSPPRSRR